ncbi:MAG: sigma-E factor negative regulatory protein RseC [Rhodocyclaceae bacterium]|nr:sigma-E factor negative regulatory protein RseC [Rhodocyclaceae bacterium]
MQARARILRVDNEVAWLELADVAGGCGRCDEPGGCRSVQLAHAFGGAEKVFALPLSFPVKPGDQVVISIPDGAPLSAALAAYGLATVLLLAGAAVGSLLGSDGRADLYGLVGGVVGLALAWSINKALPRSRNWRHRLRMELAPEGACVQSLHTLR